MQFVAEIQTTLIFNQIPKKKYRINAYSYPYLYFCHYGTKKREEGINIHLYKYLRE